MKEKRRVKAVIYHILVFGIGLIMIYPLIWMVMSSFKPTNTIFQTAGSLFWFFAGSRSAEQFIKS